MIISKEQYNKLPEKYKKYFKELRNDHPTVKSLRLCEYLVKLVTPPGGLVLDPFAGSGTTCIACKKLGFNFIGIEKEAEYVEIARAKIEAIKENKQFELF
jgi:site-specific DNA-methyltransferase (adenine-specific)